MQVARSPSHTRSLESTTVARISRRVLQLHTAICSSLLEMVQMARLSHSAQTSGSFEEFDESSSTGAIQPLHTSLFDALTACDMTDRRQAAGRLQGAQDPVVSHWLRCPLKLQLSGQTLDAGS